MSCETPRGTRRCPRLYLFVMDPLLEALYNEGRPGFELKGVGLDIPALAQADDTLLISERISDLIFNVDIVREYSALSKWEISQSKTELTRKNWNGAPYLDIRLRCDNGGKAVPKYVKEIPAEETYRYLGFHINLTLDWSHHWEEVWKG